jgi:hypothetical protein
LAAPLTGRLGRSWSLLQREHLVERFLVGDELSLLQLPTGRCQLLRLKLEIAAESSLGVIAESLGIGDCDQKQIEG